eukprot:9792512-Alexandrium_andersonii.AAC.1
MTQGACDIQNHQQRADMLRKGPPGAVITDCKSLYDAVRVSETAGLGLSDKRAAVEAMAIREALSESNNTMRW